MSPLFSYKAQFALTLSLSNEIKGLVKLFYLDSKRILTKSQSIRVIPVCSLTDGTKVDSTGLCLTLNKKGFLLRKPFFIS